MGKPMTPARHERIARTIREHWGKVSVSEIGGYINESQSTICKVASEIGMPRLGTSHGAAKAMQLARLCPEKPKGMTAEQIKWAKANWDHPEACMIRGWASGRV